MTAVVHVDAEDCAKQWLLTTSVVPLVTVGNRVQVYLAMPIGAPLPVITLSRVGGAPVFTSDVPVDCARISFSIWAANRPQCKAIVSALVSEAESLHRTGPVIVSSGRIDVIETVSNIWLPDVQSDTSRYVVDLRMWIRAHN